MTTTTKFDGFDDLDDFDTIQVAKTDNRTKYPCLACVGTGKTNARGYSKKCPACQGRGHFLTSPEKRMASKHNRQDAFFAKRKAFIDQHEDLYKWLSDNSSWNSFGESLLRQIQSRGSLTANQLSAAERMVTKHKATMAKREQDKKDADKNAPILDLTTIHEVFATAQESGIGKPRLRIDSLVVSLAPSTGVNKGHLYVKDDGEYAGKITPEGRFIALRSARNAITDELMLFVADPLAAAIAYGRKTGSCACCGRKLTNKSSVEAGIGPICITNWGL